MKKFSKLTNQKIKEQPKLEGNRGKLSESDILSAKMFNLIDSCLRIQSYGPVDNRFLSGSVKIVGKEMLVEALLSMIDTKSKKESISLLESLKSKIKDWQCIDLEINSIESSIRSDRKENKENNFNKLLERYNGDLDSALIALKTKLKSSESRQKWKKDILETTLISESNKEKILNDILE
jgi:hypothetical protein